MTEEKRIRVKAMCLFVDNGRVLVADVDSIKSDVQPVVPGKFYRVLGGTMEFDESAEQAIRREIREELDSEIEDLQYLDVIENRFTHVGERGHEVVFLFKGELSRKDIAEHDIIHIIEPTYEFDAVWVPIQDILNGNKPLYPATDYARFLVSKS